MALNVSDIVRSRSVFGQQLACGGIVRSIGGRSIAVAAAGRPAEEFVDDHQHGADRDEGVGEIEDGEGPDRRVEQDVVDDVAVDGAVDQIADRAADDQRKADARERPARAPCGSPR